MNTLVIQWENVLARVINQPDVAHVLHHLHDRYRLVVGSLSYKEAQLKIQTNLLENHIEGFFDEIVDLTRFNQIKPADDYQKELASELGKCIDCLMIVGVDYKEVVLRTLESGWYTIWYNPQSVLCPGSIPVHHAEIQSISTLSFILEQRKLPSYGTCLLWIIDEGIGPTLWQHVERVAVLSYQLAVWMRAQGISVDPILTHRGGLLHDLGKISGLNSSISHGEVGARRLYEKSQPELAEIARRHQLFNLVDNNSQPITWEQKIVYYADKIVEGGAIVSLEERMLALRQRYPVDDKRIVECLPALLSLQEEFCQVLNLTPIGLIDRFRSSQW